MGVRRKELWVDLVSGERGLYVALLLLGLAGGYPECPPTCGACRNNCIGARLLAPYTLF